MVGNLKSLQDVWWRQIINIVSDINKENSEAVTEELVQARSGVTVLKV
jgi:hypothetical protein